MTVHQAKGLEFPIVFVPGCGAPERRDFTPVLYHADLGVGLRVEDERTIGNRVHSTPSRRVRDLRDAPARRVAAPVLRRRHPRTRPGGVLRRATGRRRHLARPPRHASPRIREPAPFSAASTARPLSPLASRRPPRRARGSSFRRHPRRAKETGQRLSGVVTKAASASSTDYRRRADTPWSVDRRAAGAVATAVDGGGHAARRLSALPAPLPPVSRARLARASAAARAASSEPPSEVGEARARSAAARNAGPPPPRALRLRARRARTSTDCSPPRATIPSSPTSPTCAPTSRAFWPPTSRAASRIGRFAASCRFCWRSRWRRAAASSRARPDRSPLLEPEAVTVVDYKHARAGDPDDYQFQLEAYALAVRRLYPQAPSVRVGLAFLKDPDPTPRMIAPAPSAPSSAAGRARSLADARARESWDGRPLDFCQRLHCGYVYRCHPEVAR